MNLGLNIHGNFTPVDENDEELEIDTFLGIRSYGMTVNCAWGEDGYFEWNTEACHSEYSGYEADLHLQAGDPIFEAIYTVKPDVLLTTRSLPVTIHSALVKDGGEITVNDITLDAEINVRPSENYYTTSIYKEGNGNVIAPAIMLPNEEIEINVISDENNELLGLEINGQDMTDQLVNNTLRMNATEDLNISAYFRPVYTETEDDGDSSEEGSSSKIDTDLGDQADDEEAKKDIPAVPNTGVSTIK